MIKAVRERKLETSWSNPNPEYEAALTRYVRAVLDASRPNPFIADFHAFVAGAARAAAITSLAQVTLKLTAPGIPDIYQGCELWDLNLVDPDNRRPVDWGERRELLQQIRGMRPADLGREWRDGREKLYATSRLLALRRNQPDLFSDGDYQPLEAAGEASKHLCAFARRRGERVLVVAVPRLVHQLYHAGETAVWGDTELGLPAPGSWQSVLDGRCVTGCERVPADELFRDFPVAVLVRERPAPVS
jgi:(1->4)-alpha-D-glucan 1-alpha-D-glucosylmutase